MRRGFDLRPSFRRSDELYLPVDLIYRRNTAVFTFTDDESTFSSNRYPVHRVESFFHRGSPQLPQRACDCGDWNSLLSSTLVVAPNRVSQRSLKKVRDHAKPGFARRSNISGAVARQ